MNKTAIHVMTGTAAVLGLCFSAQAATVSVDCDAGNTITAALAGVKPGDTVLASGTCNEQVSFAPEMVRITLDGQKKTTITHPGKGAPSPHTVFIRGKDITVKGITVVGGLDGIHLSGPASAELDGNVVNKAARAGIHIDKGSVARIINNTIQESGAYGIDITGVSLAYIGVRIPRIPALSPNIVRNNGAAGINIERSSEAWIVGNTIENNKGSGVLVTRNSQADVFGNSISGNAGDGITASHMAGVNFTNEDKLFDLGPNETQSKNAGYGLNAAVGGYVDGPLGALDGAKGAKSIDAGCIDRLTN
jgi:parallel beta-helix repeat protein